MWLVEDVKKCIEGANDNVILDSVRTKDQIDALQKQVNDLNSKLDEILKTLKK